MELQHKSFAGNITIKDADQGIVRAVVGRVGVKDLEGDVFLPGSFGRQEVRVSAYGHSSWPHRGNMPLVGRGTIEEHGSDVVAEVRFFLQTQAGREHFEVVKEMANLQEWSFGFHPSRAETSEVPPSMQGQGVRNAYSRVPVEEVSPVLLAASIGTRTVAVKCDACAAKDKEPLGEEPVAEAEAEEAPEPEEVKAEVEVEVELEPEGAPEEEAVPDLREQIAREIGRAVALQASA
jgi:hypothetical protein